MPSQERWNNIDRSAQEAVKAQDLVKRIAEAVKENTKNHSLDILKEDVVERQKEARSHANREIQNLRDMEHEILQRELKEMQTSEKKAESPDIRQEQEKAHKKETELLESFQKNQIEQLSEWQRLEERAAQHLSKVIKELEYRQTMETNSVAKKANLEEKARTEMLKQLEDEHEHQREALQENMREQQATLNQYKKNMDNQMKLDKAFIENELYDKRREPNHEERLKEVVERQEDFMKEALKETQDQLTHFEGQWEEMKQQQKNNIDRSAQEAVKAQDTVKRTTEVIREMTKDHSLDNFKEDVMGRQKEALNQATREKENIHNEHETLQRELKEMQASEKKAESPDTRPEQEKAHKKETELLERFQKNQLEQVAEWQQLEEQVAQNQSKALKELENRQNIERNSVSKKANLEENARTEMLKQLEAEDKHQREAFHENIKEQQAILNQYKKDMDNQMKLDNAFMGNEVYDRRQESDHEERFRKVVERQEDFQKEALREIQDKLTHLERQWEEVNRQQNSINRSTQEAAKVQNAVQHKAEAIKNQYLDKMMEDAAERQKEARNLAARESQKLLMEHEILQRELKEMHTSENKAESSDIRQEQEKAHKKETELLESFQKNQIEQLSEWQRLEERAAQDQSKVIGELEDRQTIEMKSVSKKTNLNEKAEMMKQLEVEHKHQREVLQENIKEQQDALNQYKKNMDNQMKLDKAFIENELYDKRREPNHEERLKEVVEHQKDLRNEALRETRYKLSHLERRWEETQTNLNLKKLNQLRDRLEVTLTNRKFSDEAVQRIARAATVKVEEGKQLSAQEINRQREAAFEHTKGQILEESLALDIKIRAEAENASRVASRRLEFIEGDRIRDEHYRKLTDGLLVWRDDDNRKLHIVEAYEAKAGDRAARELNRKLEALSKRGAEELQAYARDLALDDVLGAQRIEKGESPAQYAMRQAEQLKNLTNIQAQSFEDLTNKHTEELHRYRIQVLERGQIGQTEERLYESTLLIDGKWYGLAVEGRPDVVKVLPKDIAMRQMDAMRIDVTKQQLAEAARFVIEELEK